jgi:hypothetical protein
VSAPVRSTFQTDISMFSLILDVTRALFPGAIAFAAQRLMKIKREPGADQPGLCVEAPGLDATLSELATNSSRGSVSWLNLDGWWDKM